MNYALFDSLEAIPIQLHLSEYTSVPVFEVLGIDMSHGNSETSSWQHKLILVDMKSGSKIQRRYDKINQDKSFERKVNIGNMVFLKKYALSNVYENHIKKLFNLYVGPYFCYRKPCDKVVGLLDPMTGTIVGRYSVDQCKLWTPTDAKIQEWLSTLRDKVSLELYQSHNVEVKQ